MMAMSMYVYIFISVLMAIISALMAIIDSYCTYIRTFMAIRMAVYVRILMDI